MLRQALREQLSEARQEPEMDLTAAYARCGSPRACLLQFQVAHEHLSHAGAYLSLCTMKGPQQMDWWCLGCYHMGLLTSSARGTPPCRIPAVALGDAAVVIPYATATLHRGSSSLPSNSFAMRNGSNANNRSNSSSGAGGPLDRIMGSMGAGGSSSGSGSTAQGAAVQKRAASRPTEKKVIPVLPWLLVTSGRLDTRDITHIASHRGLAALLELGLSIGAGTLAVRGSEGTAASGSGAPESNGVAAPTPMANGASSDARPGINSSGLPGAAWGRGKTQEATGPAAAAPQPAPPPPPTAEVRLRLLLNAAASLHRLAVRWVWCTLSV